MVGNNRGKRLDIFSVRTCSFSTLSHEAPLKNSVTTVNLISGENYYGHALNKVSVSAGGAKKKSKSHS